MINKSNTYDSVTACRCLSSLNQNYEHQARSILADVFGRGASGPRQCRAEGESTPAGAQFATHQALTTSSYTPLPKCLLA
eukprot:scaffold156175_cov22-Tisochrysis_lutea.AAC.1